MNKQSIIKPIPETRFVETKNLFQRIAIWARARKVFLSVVVAPTLLLAAYLYLVAADQYQTEADFNVRSSGAPAASATSGFGQLLGLAGGATQAASDDATVADYLTSHDAVAALRQRINLVELFRRPEADILSRLNTDDPTPEKLLKYYRSKVTVHINHENNISTLQVRAFRPEDAYTIIQALLQLGEQRVNTLNDRNYSDAISSAKQQLAEAEVAVGDVQARMTALRRARGDIDPQVAGDAQIKLSSEVNGNLAAAQAQLNTMAGLISHSSPQYIALERQVRSLQAEAASQAQYASGHSSTIANDLGNFEDLKIRQEFAAKRYEAAAASLERAQEQAQRQQLYLIRIVEPNHPIKALYPERGRILMTVFVGLLLVYSMGWLLAAGVREHAG